MAGLRKGIQVTNEFDGYEPPEDTRAYGDAYADDSRMMMAEPEVAYTMEDEDEEKREAQNSAKKEPSRRTMSDVAGASSGAGTNNDFARGVQPHIYQLKQSMKRKARKSQRMGSEKTKRQKKRAGLQQTKHGIVKECSPKKNA